jgi:hypothetical protein
LPATMSAMRQITWITLARRHPDRLRRWRPTDRTSHWLRTSCGGDRRNRWRRTSRGAGRHGRSGETSWTTGYPRSVAATSPISPSHRMFVRPSGGSSIASREQASANQEPRGEERCRQP